MCAFYVGDNMNKYMEVAFKEAEKSFKTDDVPAESEETTLIVYVQEQKAPDGYQLDTKIYPVEAALFTNPENPPEDPSTFTTTMWTNTFYFSI